MTDAAPLLDVAGLTVRYGAVEAVRDLSLQVYPGETVCLIGANGAGKTTTLRAISGVVRPAVGAVFFAGQRIDRQGPDRIVSAGLIQCPEGRLVFGRMSVEENLRLGSYSRRHDPEAMTEAERVYELLPVLRERRRQLAGTLSGGEQQMLAIGRALMGRPKVLLLDEPSMGLAPVLVEQIFSIIKDINTQGTTILLVEQNALMALGVAHRGYVLQPGQIVLADSAQGLSENETVQKAYLGME